MKQINQNIVAVLQDAGLTLELAPGGGLIVSPASRLTQELRGLIRDNKAVLVDRLREAQELTAREEMRDDCLGTPPHLQAGLLAYFDYCADRPGPERTLAVRQAKAATEKASKRAPEPDPSTWRELAAAYHLHHFGCAQCIAGGQGRGLRCSTGAALWNIYQSTN